MAQLFKVIKSNQSEIIVASNMNDALEFLNSLEIDFEEIEDFGEHNQILDTETNTYLSACEIEDLTNEKARWSIIANSSTI